MIRDVMTTPVAAASRRPASPAAEAKPGAMPEQPPLSPDMRVDPALNLVVIEFRDTKGELRHSIPTPRELDAYRSGSAGTPPALDLKG